MNKRNPGLYMDTGMDSIQQKSQRTGLKRKSKFCSQSQLSGLSNLYENVLDLQVFQEDSYLHPFREHFEIRNRYFVQTLQNIIRIEGSLEQFAKGYLKYGFNEEKDSIIYREYAPGCKQMFLMGDFNKWNRKSHPMWKDEFGVWTIEIKKNQNGDLPIPHGSKLRVYIQDAWDQWCTRIPVYITIAIQDKQTFSYDGVYWNPPDKFVFQYKRPPRPRFPKIYEVHIGMAGIEPRTHTYKEFETIILPRIVKQGYNCVQIMAVAEHAYYASFGYHVTLPFAVSSWFGNPTEFKELVDAAHSYGLFLIIDLVHSHASKNIQDGFNQWDGTDHQYFHGGGKGNHPLWDSKVYDYGKWEVQKMLLSNISYFMNEYMVDGFRFDGVTSMLYKHHGSGVGFTGQYHEYFNYDIDMDSLCYLMLANELIHKIYPDAISIAEDVSGYPTIGRTIQDGGLGFDYRLAMAVPDKWIKLLKEVSDEWWPIGQIISTLINRRKNEKCICYAESHDQALVGDKTISMWLFDAEIYTGMSDFNYGGQSLRVSRGISLHKLIRMITFSMGGEGYLNFMGNEFGHPEWIDFPREGNGWSYNHCRRRFDICDDGLLRFKYLNNWDMSMLELEEQYKYMSSDEFHISDGNEEGKIICFTKGDLLFIFNFHPTESFGYYTVGTRWLEDHIMVLNSDDYEFGGLNRLANDYNNKKIIIDEPYNCQPYSLIFYIPSRTVQVYCPISKKKDVNLKTFNSQPLKIQDYLKN